MAAPGTVGIVDFLDRLAPSLRAELVPACERYTAG